MYCYGRSMSDQITIVKVNPSAKRKLKAWCASKNIGLIEFALAAIQAACDKQGIKITIRAD